MRLLLLVCVGLSAGLLLFGTASADSGDSISVVAVRPTTGPDLLETRLERLREAHELRELVENVVAASSGRQPVSVDEVQRALGRSYLVDVYNCSGDIGCIQKRLRPLRTVVGLAVVGDYFADDQQLTIRLRVFDLASAALKNEITFVVPGTQKNDLSVWTKSIAPAFQDTGSLTIVSNVTGFSCELDNKPCNLDANGTIAGVVEGEHIVTLSHAGHAEESKAITVVRGKDTRIAVPLRRLATQGLDIAELPETAKKAEEGKGKAGKGKPVLSTWPMHIKGALEPEVAYVMRGPPQQPFATRLNFYVRRANVHVAGEPRKWLHFAIGLEYIQVILGPRELVLYPLKDAYVDIKFWGQTLKLGQFKLPFGWERYTPSVYLPVIDRSLLTPRLTLVGSRDVGVGLFGSFKISGEWREEHRFAYVNGDGGNQLNIDNHLQPVGRVGLAHGQAFSIGVSAVAEWATRETLVEKTRKLGFDAELAVPWGFLAVEGVYAWMRAPIKTTQYGFYAMAVANLPRRLQLGARYEFLDVDSKLPGAEQRITGLAGYQAIPGTLAILSMLTHDLTTRMPNPIFSSVTVTDRVPGSSTLIVGARVTY